MRNTLALLFIAGLLGCGASTPAPTGGKLRVTATTGMIADVARQIGGDHVVVTALMGPGVDPHLYKATQGDLAALGGAGLVLYNGPHIEGRMGDRLENMGKRVKSVQVTRRIPEDALIQADEFEGHPDPHVWFDCSLWRLAAEEIRDALLEVDPGNKDAYTTRAEAYLAEIDRMHAYAKEQFGAIPEGQRILITAHDAFGYLGRAYGLEVMGIQGISTASEYGLQDLDRLTKLVVERGVKAVFVESSVSPKSIEALIAGAASKGHTVRAGGELFSDALGAEGTPEGTYLGMMRHNVDTIAGALR